MFFFFNDTATTEIYTLSLHDALPIFRIAGPRIRLAHRDLVRAPDAGPRRRRAGESVPSQPRPFAGAMGRPSERSEEHTSELQSRSDLVCRLLLENKNIHPSDTRSLNL